MRIDKFLSESYKISRTKAQELIKQGLVFYDDKLVDKVSFEVVSENKVFVKDSKQYVSRGAYKLLGAIKDFNLNFKEKVVLDIGASTGGFTEVALENGAKKVYAVDIGENELSPILQKDGRVINMHSTDFRSLTRDICKDVQMIIGDVSFVSLKHIFPKIVELFGNKIEVCILFKPQFECGLEQAKKYKGVVLDKKLHVKLLTDFVKYLQCLGFKISGLNYSKIKGKQGNIEYLFYLNGNKEKNYELKTLVYVAFVKLKVNNRFE